jgi:putative pyruvate formate lyase activating enzyme
VSIAQFCKATEKIEPEGGMPPMNDAFQPAYIKAHETGLLKKRTAEAIDMLKSCSLCPRKCRVNRLATGDLGVCKTGRDAWVSSYHPHFGEERPLVGRNGSGTIFFTHCNLLCNFCQNFDISHEGNGKAVRDEQLAAMMIELQEAGCHNINFVTPTHVVPQILSAVGIAANMGLRVPLIYNCGGYDRVKTLRLLSGIFDIYMPDFKFWDAHIADASCSAPDYPDVARKALVEMYRQVGDLAIDPEGIAQKGLLIRHLVLPDGLAGTREIMRFIVKKVSANSYVNMMPQYRPCGRAYEIPQLSKSISDDDFKQAMTAAREEGVKRFDRARRTFVIW